MKNATMKAMADRHQRFQPLLITFAEGTDGFRALSVIKSFCEKGCVRFESELLALAILASHDWAHTNRKLKMYFTLGHLWRESAFLQIAEQGIESIQIGSDSPLNALQSSRQKKREEAMSAIVEAVLTPEVRDEIKGWGLTVHHELIESEGLHAMKIVVRNEAEVAFSLLLDGWSGSIFDFDLAIAPCFCDSYETVQVQLQTVLEKYLERATATT